ncbi:hypothetical protein MRX96_024020 [Rhipicephalus microplus]
MAGIPKLQTRYADNSPKQNHWAQQSTTPRIHSGRTQWGQEVLDLRVVPEWESQGTQIRHEDTGLPVSDVDKHLADHMRKLYDFSNGDPEIILTDDNPINKYCLSNNIKWEVTRLALDRAIQRIGAHTARGLDGIPARLLKCLGDEARRKLADIFSGIMTGEPIPEDWRSGRVILVPKRGGDAGLLRGYRSLTGSSVLYRTFTQILKT